MFSIQNSNQKWDQHKVKNLFLMDLNKSLTLLYNEMQIVLSLCSLALNCFCMIHHLAVEWNNQYTYTRFQKSMPEIQIEKERKFNIEAKIYTHSGAAAIKRPCENIENITRLKSQHNLNKSLRKFSLFLRSTNLYFRHTFLKPSIDMSWMSSI